MKNLNTASVLMALLALFGGCDQQKDNDHYSKEDQFTEQELPNRNEFSSISTFNLFFA